MKKKSFRSRKKCKKLVLQNNKYFFNEYNDDDTYIPSSGTCLLSCINYLQKIKKNYVIEELFQPTIY